MSDTVLQFTGITRIPDTVPSALEKAKAWGMTRVVIAGWTEEGELVFGGSHSEIAEALLILEVSKKRLLEVAEQGGA